MHRWAALGWLLLAACTERIPLVSVGDAEPPDVDNSLPRAAADGSAPDGRPGSFDASRPERGVDASCREIAVDPIAYTLEAPEVIVALDRSFSMFVGRLGATSRILAVHSALRAAITTHQRAIQFGYEEFPVKCEAGAGCCASPVLVPPRFSAWNAIENRMRCESGACFETSHDSPVGEALGRCRSFFTFASDTGRPRYVLLVTDGDPTCAFERDPCERAVGEASRLASNGIKTAVVAIGEDARTSACLERLAVAGQLGRPGTPSYHWAGDEAQLRQALLEILGGIAPRVCRLSLREPPPNPSRMVLTLDHVLVPADPTQTNGWSFDPPNQAMHVSIHGPWCDRVRANPQDLRVWRTTCQQCGGTYTCAR